MALQFPIRIPRLSAARIISHAFAKRFLRIAVHLTIPHFAAVINEIAFEFPEDVSRAILQSQLHELAKYVEEIAKLVPPVDAERLVSQRFADDIATALSRLTPEQFASVSERLLSLASRHQSQSDTPLTLLAKSSDAAADLKRQVRQEIEDIRAERAALRAMLIDAHIALINRVFDEEAVKHLFNLTKMISDEVTLRIAEANGIRSCFEFAVLYDFLNFGLRGSDRSVGLGPQAASVLLVQENLKMGMLLSASAIEQLEQYGAGMAPRSERYLGIYITRLAMLAERKNLSLFDDRIETPRAQTIRRWLEIERPSSAVQRTIDARLVSALFGDNDVLDGRRVCLVTPSNALRRAASAYYLNYPDHVKRLPRFQYPYGAAWGLYCDMNSGAFERMANVIPSLDQMNVALHGLFGAAPPDSGVRRELLADLRNAFAACSAEMLKFHSFLLEKVDAQMLDAIRALEQWLDALEHGAGAVDRLLIESARLARSLED
jgi:hypothetical protein